MIASYQEELTGLLAATSGPARAALLAWSGQLDDLTRSYLDIACSTKIPLSLRQRLAARFR